MKTHFNARYDLWIRLLIIGLPLFLIATAIFQIRQGEVGAGATAIVISALVLVLFWFAMPRGYVVETDKLQIILGWPLSLNLHFNSIEEIQVARAWAAIASSGVRFSTSVKTPVIIKRSRGANYVISPDNRENFIAEATKAIEEYQKNN